MTAVDLDFLNIDSPVAFQKDCHCQVLKHTPDNLRKQHQKMFFLNGASEEAADVVVITELPEGVDVMKRIIGLCRKSLKDDAETKIAIIPAVRCRPRLDKFGPYATIEPCWREHTEAAVMKMSPKSVVTFGRALYAVTGYSKIMPMHFFSDDDADTWIYAPKLKAPVCAAPHHSTWFDESSGNSWDVYEKFFTIRQIDRALAFARSPLPIPRRERRASSILTGPANRAKAIAYIKSIIDTAPKDGRLVIDIETGGNGLDWQQDPILSIQLGVGDGIRPVTQVGFLEWYGDDEFVDALNLLLTERPDLEVVMQNGGFDMKFLWRNGVYAARDDFDTMHTKRAINENSPAGMKEQVWFYTPYGGYEEELKLARRGAKKKGFQDVPKDVLERYALMDPVATDRLAIYQKKRLFTEDTEVINNYFRIIKPSWTVFARMERRGVPISLQKLYAYNTKLQKKAEKLATLVRARAIAASGDDAYKSLNVNSKPQISSMLKKIEGFQPLADDKGKPMVNAQGLLQLNKDTIPLYAERIPALQSSNTSPEVLHAHKMIRALLHLNHLMKEIGQIGITKYDDMNKALSVKERDFDNFFGEAIVGEKAAEDKVFDPDEYDDDAVKGLIGCVYEDRLYGNYDPTGTKTGRAAAYSGLRSSINMQNQQKEKSYRQIYTPPPGYVWLDIDYKTMEVVILSQKSGSGPLERVILDKMDMHCYMASKIRAVRGAPISYEDFLAAYNNKMPGFSEERRDSKPVTFSVFYGSTEYGLSNSMNIDVDDAKLVLQAAEEAYPDFVAYRETHRKQAKAEGWVSTLTGKRRRFPKLKFYGNREAMGLPHDGAKSDMNWAGMNNEAINAPIQGTSGQVTILAMIAIDDEYQQRGMESEIVINTHDSITQLVPIEEIPYALAISRKWMKFEWYENPEVKGTRSACKLDVDEEIGQVWGYGSSVKEYVENNPDTCFREVKYEELAGIDLNRVCYQPLATTVGVWEREYKEELKKKCG